MEGAAVRVGSDRRCSLPASREPVLDAVKAASKNSVVTRRGLARTESECRMAEFDARYVSGVDKVVDKIEVRA